MILHRIRIASLLMIVGLLIELGSLNWRSPISFVCFFVLGGLTLAAGILTYLVTIVAQGD
jgi:hypothetical protein